MEHQAPLGHGSVSESMSYGYSQPWTSPDPRLSTGNSHDSQPLASMQHSHQSPVTTLPQGCTGMQHVPQGTELHRVSHHGSSDSMNQHMPNGMPQTSGGHSQPVPSTYGFQQAASLDAGFNEHPVSSGYQSIQVSQAQPSPASQYNQMLTSQDFSNPDMSYMLLPGSQQRSGPDTMLSLTTSQVPEASVPYQHQISSNPPDLQSSGIAMALAGVDGQMQSLPMAAMSNGAAQCQPLQVPMTHLPHGASPVPEITQQESAAYLPSSCPAGHISGQLQSAGPMANGISYGQHTMAGQSIPNTGSSHSIPPQLLVQQGVHNADPQAQFHQQQAAALAAAQQQASTQLLQSHVQLSQSVSTHRHQHFNAPAIMHAHAQDLSGQSQLSINNPMAVSQQNVVAQVAHIQKQHQEVSHARAQQEAVAALAHAQAQAHAVAAQSASNISTQQAHQAAAQQAQAQAEQAATSAQQFAVLQSHTSATLSRLAQASSQQQASQILNPISAIPQQMLNSSVPIQHSMTESYSGGPSPNGHPSLPSAPPINSLQHNGAHMQNMIPTLPSGHVPPSQTVLQPNGYQQLDSGNMAHFPPDLRAHHGQIPQTVHQPLLMSQQAAMNALSGYQDTHQSGLPASGLAPQTALPLSAQQSQQQLLHAAAQVGGLSNVAAMVLAGAPAAPHQPIAPLQAPGSPQAGSLALTAADVLSGAQAVMTPEVAVALASMAGQSLANQSIFRGVQYDPSNGLWHAAFVEGDINKPLGHFNTEEEAAMAVDHEAIRLFGSKPPHLNLPQKIVESVIPSATDPKAATSKAEPYRSSKFRGVSRGRGKKKWRAMIQHHKKQIHVGYYDSGLEAARAYDREAVKLLGPDAITNFPLSDYYPELTEQGRQGMPGEEHPAGNEHDYDYDEYDDDEEDEQGGSGAGDSERGPEACAKGHPAASASTAPDGQAAGLPPLYPRAPGPQMVNDDVQLPMANNTSAGTASDCLYQTEIHRSDVMEKKSIEQLLMEAGRTELWGVKQVGAAWRAQITIDLGCYKSPAEAAAAHDRAAIWTLGVTANTNLAKGNDLFSLPLGVDTPARSQEIARASSAELSRTFSGEPYAKRSKQSQYHGIQTKDGGETWFAVVKVQGTQHEYGPFMTEAEAARYYDRCSALLWGLQARTNFPLMDVLCTSPDALQLVQQIAYSYNLNRESQAKAMADQQSASQPGGAISGRMMSQQLSGILHHQEAADPNPYVHSAIKTEPEMSHEGFLHQGSYCDVNDHHG